MVAVLKFLSISTVSFAPQSYDINHHLDPLLIIDIIIMIVMIRWLDWLLPMDFTFSMEAEIKSPMPVAGNLKLTMLI